MDKFKFIDSCVGAIARKVQDEFDESKHPRDKGGKFSSKGGEGRGASASEETDFEKEAKKEIGSGKNSGGEDDEGYMGVSKEELAEEEEYENARERARREKDDDRVTGPEDRDYMNEEDDDEEEQDDDSTSESVDAVYRQARNYTSTHVEELVEYAEDDGYDAELLSDEFMLLSRNGVDYRAHIDKAGDTYYVDRVEEW